MRTYGLKYTNVQEIYDVSYKSLIDKWGGTADLTKYPSNSD